MEERNETVNWANSLSRQCSSVLFFSPYSGSLSRFSRLPYRSISHTHSWPRRRGRIHFVFIKFHKASRQTTRPYFPFSRLEGRRRGGECRGKWRTRGDDYVGATLSSFSYSPVRIRSLFFSRGPFPERELGVTNQPTCFTFKSSCLAISNRVHRNGVCTHYDSLLEMYNFPREMPVSASSVSRDLGLVSQGRSGTKAVPA